MVEDDAPHRRALELGLSARGFDVTVVGDGHSVRDAVDSAHHDVILLDLGLPDVDGIELCRRLRVWPGAPIVVSGDADEARIIAALDVGADDYVVKPVAIDVLVARIGVQLRHAAVAASVVQAQILEVGDIRLDTAAHEVHVGGTPVTLNAQQFTILSILLRNAGKVVAHDVLARASGYGNPSDRNALRVAVSRLRHRLGRNPDRPEILTEKPVGYRLTVPMSDQRTG